MNRTQLARKAKKNYWNYLKQTNKNKKTVSKTRETEEIPKREKKDKAMTEQQNVEENAIQDFWKNFSFGSIFERGLNGLRKLVREEIKLVDVAIIFIKYNMSAG